MAQYGSRTPRAISYAIADSVVGSDSSKFLLPNFRTRSIRGGLPTLSSSVPQSHAVRHTGAKEPMVLAIVDAAHKIRTVADVAAVQF